MRELDLFVDADGVECVYSDALTELFEGESVSTRRASHVEPAPGGGWAVDLTPVGGPASVGPFALRQEALDWEVAWLAREMAERRLRCESM